MQAQNNSTNMGLTNPLKAVARATRTIFCDIAEGTFALLHNGLIMLGAAVAIAAIILASSADLRHAGQEKLSQWVVAREMATTGIKPDYGAIARSTALNPLGLGVAEAEVTHWISKKYRVAPEPIAATVHEAFEAGRQNNVDPILILAVAAIESGFNPFAQSHAGAQGLMQVMTRVHSDKYAYFGGDYAAFDPKSNVRVGVRILREYIERTGSLQSGLKWYVGAANLGSDGGYAAKVIAEYKRMYEAAWGRPVPAEALRQAHYDADAQDTRIALAPDGKQ